MLERLSRDFERFRTGLPPDWVAQVRDQWRIDLSARYLGVNLPHPVGKASGQLSLSPAQLEADAEAGLAFVVLKTVIGEDPAGARSMAAWAVPESRMRVERRAASDGSPGWTVTWKGRGWDRSFEEYLALIEAGRALTGQGALLVVPSVKLHLPRDDEEFRTDEYHHTIGNLARAWGDQPLLIEKDFSPTLAGDRLATERAAILRWVREVPGVIRAAAPAGARVALKLMNATFDDAFQVAMLRAAAEGGADGVTVFNRLWDAGRGVAYGGGDLSARNLRVLDAAGPGGAARSGTGDIGSGRKIVEYALRGCESVQLHTFFQLPLSEYPATRGHRSERALHALVFHPRDGLLAAMLDLEARGRLRRREGVLHYLDLIPGGAA